MGAMAYGNEEEIVQKKAFLRSQSSFDQFNYVQLEKRTTPENTSVPLQ
jgi:hypothetical protein